MAAATLLLTDDESLVVAVGRLAAAAGVDLDVERDPRRAGAAWTSSAAVLVGADAAPAACASSPGRRDQVHVLCPGAAADAVFRHAVRLGASSVLELPEAEPWLAELLSDLGDGGGGPGTVVAVVGGAGGSGASTFAAALAIRASGLGGGPGVDGAAGGPVALIDLDPLGPGLRRLLGREDERGVTWPELDESRGRLGARALRTALGGSDGVGVLGWGDEAGGVRRPPATALLREVVSAARRGHPLVVLDVPRHECAGLAPVLAADHWLVVTTPGVASVAATARVVATLRGSAPQVHLAVVERPGGPDATAVARVLGVPLVAAVPRHRRLDEHLDLGLGPLHGRGNPLARATRDVLDAWGLHEGAGR